MDTYEALRVAAARLIGADRGEIAIVKNTSEGIATIAMGMDWRPGDRIVAFKEEFPANYYPWLRLEAQRCGVEWLSIHDPLHVIERATHGAKLLAVSFVQYLSGLRMDIEAIGEICHRNRCFFFVDAIQGLGAFPLNVRTAHIDSIFPKEFGWTTVAGYNDYASRDMALRPDAGRYECGTLNTIGCFGLRASIEFLLEVGIERIGPIVQALTDQLAEGARQKGYQVLAQRTPETGSGIVALHKPNMDSRHVVRDLRQRGIIAAPRQGWVRFSPHFYISPEEIDRVVEALP
jgi:selenocysteine lyase/cysteine desulfurase